MTIDTLFKLLFGATMSGGLGLAGWREFSYYMDSKTAFYEFERIYSELGDYFRQEIKPIPGGTIEPMVRRLNASCYPKLNIHVPRSITRTVPITGKLNDEKIQSKITRETFKIAGIEAWVFILRDNMNNYDGLINYTKILKRACDIYSSPEDVITLEFGQVPQTYRVFSLAGIKTKWGFRIKNKEFENILYGAIEGDYQTTNGYETNIDLVLNKITRK